MGEEKVKKSPGAKGRAGHRREKREHMPRTKKPAGHDRGKTRHYREKRGVRVITISNLCTALSDKIHKFLLVFIIKLDITQAVLDIFVAVRRTVVTVF